MDINRIECIKQWTNRIGAAVSTLAMCMLAVFAVMDKCYALASVFVFLIALIIVSYVHDELIYKRWQEENGDSIEIKEEESK